MNLKIAMLSYRFPPQYSGAALQAIALAGHLRKRGHHIEFFTIKWPGLKEDDTFNGFKVQRVEAGRGKKHKEIRLWFNLLMHVLKRRRDFDILHSHGAYYINSFVGPIARLAGLKSLVKASLAGDDLSGLRASLAGHIHYLFLNMADACIGISRDLVKEFLMAGLPAERIYYLPNGVDTERFHPKTLEEKGAMRRVLGFPERQKIVLTVGVLDHRKNIGWLMEEWARNDAFGTGAILVAIGPRSREDTDGALRGSFERLAQNHTSILRLLEYVDDIEKYYGIADFFILPSRNEGLPNVVLEAMASGLPCVASKVSGVEELVQEGRTGYTFTIGDSSSLRPAVLNVIHDTDAMGRQARQLIEEKYALTILAEQYENLYQKLIKHPHGRGK